MAVTAVRRTRTRQATFAAGYRSEYKVEFLITCNTVMLERPVYDGASTIALPSDRLPGIYDAYSYDGFTDATSHVLSIDLSTAGDSLLQWKAVVNYGKLPEGSTPGDNPADPLLAPIKYHIEWMEEQRDVEKDRFGNPIKNSAGDQFDEDMQEPELYPVLVAVKNYATIQDILDVGIEYHRSVNSVTFFGGAPRTVKFLPIQSDPVQLANGISFYRASLRFAYNPAKWDRQFVDKGWRVRPGAGQPPVPAMDNNVPVSAPVLLAANGTLLPDGAAYHFINTEVLPEKDYNLIGI